jgi:copper(I)-binding protein
MLWLFAPILAVAVQAVVPAQPGSTGTLRLENRLVRAAPEAGADVAAYLVIANDGDPDRLAGISCACAERVEIHRIVRRGDDVSMETTAFLDVPSGGVVEIRPGSDLHLMLSGVREPMPTGETIEMVLQFEQAGAVTAGFVAVEDTRAAWRAARAPD